MILIFSLPQFCQSYLTSGIYYNLMPWALPIAQISLTGNIYFTIAITIER
jgi:cell division septal protein FtsQ